MGSLEFEHGSGNLSLNGNFVLEYQVRSDSYFLGSKDPQEFRLAMRELYTTYSGNNFERLDVETVFGVLDVDTFLRRAVPWETFPRRLT